MFKIYDVTLLEREEPERNAGVDRRDGASECPKRSPNSGLFDGTPSATFGEDERDALEEFRGMNNFENHSLPVLEDALARGWDDADGDGEERMVDALWHGLSRLDRK